MRPGKIYTLTNPVGNKIFYVGSTVTQLHDRLSLHVWDARNRPNSSSAAKYISKLTLKPIIETLESFDAISNDELRQHELFWVRQLRAWGFSLVNVSRPFDDNETSIRDINDDDLAFLKEKAKYTQIIRILYNVDISNVTLNNIIRRGRCIKSMYNKIQFLITKLKELDSSRLIVKSKALMVVLDETELNVIKNMMKEDIDKTAEMIGIHKNGLYKLLKSGTMRFDKYNNRKSILAN
jgi:hypothetical protein